MTQVIQDAEQAGIMPMSDPSQVLTDFAKLDALAAMTGATAGLAGAADLGPAGNVFGRTRLGGSSIFGINRGGIFGGAIRFGWSYNAEIDSQVLSIRGSLVDALKGASRSHIDIPWFGGK